MSRLRVCHVITQLELGGAQQNTLYTVAHLDREFFEASLLAGPGGILDDEARAIPDLLFETVPDLQRLVRPWQDVKALSQLVVCLRGIRPHVVHTHSSKAGILGRVAAALAGVPIVVHSVHGWGFTPNQSPAMRFAFEQAERTVSSLTQRFIAVSRANAELGAQVGVAPLESFEIIHSGVHLDAFERARDNGKLRAELGLGAGDLLVGMVACLKPQKEPADFVRLAERVLREEPGVTFVLAGDGELRSEVERLVREAGLGERFRLLGWRRDVPEIVGDLDVLVLTSLHEGLPRVVPEAMAAGKPVVATAVDGTPEAVSAGESGFLRAPHDVEGMADDLLRLLRDAGLRRAMGQAGRARTRPWDIGEMVREQERLYLELAEEVQCP